MDFSEVIIGLKKEKTFFLAVDEIMPNPMQPRRHFDSDELLSLAESIKNFGIIQPIAVKKSDLLPCPTEKKQAKYEIIAGERRWRAAQIAGLKKIPCTVFETDRQNSAMMALIENLQRSDLSYFEEAVAMNTLLLMSGKTQSELAKDLAISQSTLSNKLRLLRLSDRERLIALENGFSERHCRALVRIESERERRPLLLKIINEKLQAHETEKLIDEYLSATPLPPSEKSAKKSKPKIKGSIGDFRFLYNTIDKAVKFLHNSGYNASWSKEESGNAIEVKLSIKKET